MKKRGNIITVLSFKNYLIVFAVVVLFYYLLMNYPGMFTLPTLPKSCPEGIIPDRIPLSCSEGGCYPIRRSFEPSFTPDMKYTWADGTPITNFQLTFLPANKEGENINYRYASRVVYYKRPINPDGTIGKDISFEIDLTIDQKDLTNEGYKVVEYKCKVSEVK